MNKEINISGKKIFYHVYGIGKPVMLVHGFGEKSDVWTNQVEWPPQAPPLEGLSNTQRQLNNDPIKNKFMFIVPDLPGSGQSDMIDDMSVEGMAEVLKTILEKESLKEATMIGHSMGGYITLAFAEKYPEFLSSFGLFHSTAYADSEEKKVIRRKGIEFIKKHGAYEFLRTTTANLFSAKTKEERPELVSQFIQGLSNFSPYALIAYYESMIKRPDRTEVLKTFNKPILFIMGEYDNAIPLQDSLKQCHLPQRIYLNILHESGHLGMLEESDKSNLLLEEFLNSI